MELEEKDVVRMTYRDAKKLDITWQDICEITDGNIYAVNEGRVNDNDIITVPISLIKRN